MGSSGSGNLSDYSGSRGNGTGGTGGTDRCGLAFTCNLEEVEQCDFYVQNNSVPVPDTELTLVHQGRIFAVTADGTKVGALPTSRNYLAACMRDGFTYVGVVTASGSSPVPYVNADFTAQ